MKKLITLLFTFLICLSIPANTMVTDSTNVISSDDNKASFYDKYEFSVRGGVQIHYKFADVTAGMSFRSNHVVGVGAGYGTRYYDAVPADDYHCRFFLYHRYYIPLDRKRRISLYSDIMLGGMYIYKATEKHPDVAEKGSVRFLASWQPGISLRLWGKSNIFIGPNIGPSPGRHIGFAL